MAELLQFVITGVSVGMVYSLIALGFVLIWKSSSVANLALGQIVLISLVSIIISPQTTIHSLGEVEQR